MRADAKLVRVGLVSVSEWRIDAETAGVLSDLRRNAFALLTKRFHFIIGCLSGEHEMDTRAALKTGIDMAQFVAQAYLADLTDADMMHRPAPNCNHIKWQVGHLIVSEHQGLQSIAPGSMPSLPVGFADRYTKHTAGSDEPSAFDTKAELLRIAQEQRNGTLAALHRMTDAELDQISPEPIRSYAPTYGAVFSVQGSHWLMHAGQWAVVRRQLGHAPLF